MIEKLKAENDFSEIVAKSVFEDTKRFLILCALTPNSGFVPTKMIDLGWHQFILHTQDYQNFCLEFFGRLIHHSPKKMQGERKSDKSFLTLQTALKTFGKDLSQNWSYNGKDIQDVVAEVLEAKESGIVGFINSDPCTACVEPDDPSYPDD